MPELPEVETVRRELEPVLRGRTIVDVWADPKMGRFSDVEGLAGAAITGVRRRGKFLLADLSGARELVMHLGMTGSFRVVRRRRVPEESRLTHVRAWFDLDDGERVLYRDVRRFGRISVVQRGDYSRIPTLDTLGPEPLDDEFTDDEFARALKKTTAPVKAVLLGQRAVAGVGNIYADEALWAARIHPASRRVGPTRAATLRAEIRRILAAAIERNGTTFSDYEMVNGASGNYGSNLLVYGRSGKSCLRCKPDGSNEPGVLLRRIELAGRGTTYCPRCQRA